MAKTLTFLQLSQEFGGTKFGPFDGPEVRLGSDPARNEITLPASLGVTPEHLKLLIQGDGSYIIAPIERTAAVFLWRQGSSKAKQLTSPMAVSAGDGFSLVTAEGPRFYIEAEMQKNVNLDDVEGQHKADGPGFGGRMGKEVKRRGLARFLTSGPGRMVYRGWIFVKQGQFMSPFYIISGLTMASGFIFAGGSTCAMVSFQQKQSSMTTSIDTCETQLSELSGMSKGAEPTIPSLTGAILDDDVWTPTLNQDTDFQRAYKDALKLVFESHDDYRWVYANEAGANAFAEFTNELKGEGLDERLVRVLAYAAAQPKGDQFQVDYSILAEDSTGGRSCGRGPLRLTYRQALKLGMYDVAVDAVAPRAVVENRDEEKQRELLTETMYSANQSQQLENTRILASYLGGPFDCIFLAGADERNDLDAIASAIQRTFARAEGLPPVGEVYWMETRLFRFVGSDLTSGFEDLKFGIQNPPTRAMEQMSFLNTTAKAFLVREAAEILARSVAIPCLKMTDEKFRRRPRAFLGEPPEGFTCAYIDWYKRYDTL